MLMYIHTLYINTIVCMHYIYIHIILYIPCVHVYIYIYIKNMVYTLYADRNTYIVFIYFLSFVFQSLHCAWHAEGIIGYVLRVASWCSKYVGHHPNQTCWEHRGGCQYFPREHGPAWRPSLASWDLQSTCVMTRSPARGNVRCWCGATSGGAGCQESDRDGSQLATVQPFK